MENSNKTIWPSFRGNPFFAITLLVLLFITGLMFLAFTANSIVRTSEVGQPDAFERTIVVEGTSSSSVLPDIATIDVSVEATGTTVADAQADNSTVIDEITTKLTELGVSKKDIQTSYYNVYEDELWNPETYEYESQGWIVYQDLTIKVRNIEQVSDVLTIAGDSGATGIYGPNYSVDDSSDQKEDARELAIADAREKAESIADGLGVKLGDVVDYYEWDSADDYYYEPYAYDEYALSESIAIEPGAEDVEITVSITFELIQ